MDGSRTVFKILGTSFQISNLVRWCCLAPNLTGVRRVADSASLSSLGILVTDAPFSWLALPLAQVAAHPPCQPAAWQRALLAARLRHYVRTTLTVRVRARSLDTRVPSDT